MDPSRRQEETILPLPDSVSACVWTARHVRHRGANWRPGKKGAEGAGPVGFVGPSCLAVGESLCDAVGRWDEGFCDRLTPLFQDLACVGAADGEITGCDGRCVYGRGGLSLLLLFRFALLRLWSWRRVVMLEESATSIVIYGGQPPKPPCLRCAPRFSGHE